MIFILLAPAASGKDYLFNKLLEMNSNLTRVVSYTDRPIRSTETDGVDYHFVSKQHMTEMLLNDDMVEHTTYNVANGDTWTYATHKLSISNPNENYIMILNPDGYKAIKKKYPRQTIGFLIDRDTEARKKSYLDRDKNSDENEKKKEFERRERADQQKFSKLTKQSDIYIVDNNDFEKTAQRIKMLSDIINEYVK